MHPQDNPDFLALLAACRADPADDLPRMALSDWLVERGDPLGEYINLSLELAQARKQLIESTVFEGHMTFSQRIRAVYPSVVALEQQHWAEWAVGPSTPTWAWPNLINLELGVTGRGQPTLHHQLDYYAPVRTAWVQFNRGLVSGVSVRMNDWLGEECPNCQGLGHTRHMGHYIDMCLRCCGVGLLRPLGPYLARHPIEVMSVVGHAPGTSRSGKHVYRKDHHLWRHQTDRGLVPGVLYDRLTGGYRSNNVVSYTDDTEARKALKLAMLEWARAPKVIDQFRRQDERPVPVGRSVPQTEGVTPPD